MPSLNSLLGFQWIVGALLFGIGAARVLQGFWQSDRPQRVSDFVTKFPVRYRLSVASALISTCALLVDVSRLRYRWHVLWMAPRATTWWELAWRSVWLSCLAWWVIEQCWPALSLILPRRNGR